MLTVCAVGGGAEASREIIHCAKEIGHSISGGVKDMEGNKERSTKAL